MVVCAESLPRRSLQEAPRLGHRAAERAIVVSGRSGGTLVACALGDATRAVRGDLALVVVVVIITLMLPWDDGLALSVALASLGAGIRRLDDGVGAGWVALLDEVGSVPWRADADLLCELVLDARAALSDLSVPARSASVVVGTSSYLAAGVLGHVLGEALALSVASVEDLHESQLKSLGWEVGCNTSRLPCLQRQAAVSSSFKPVQMGLWAWLVAVSQHKTQDCDSR